MAAAVELKRMLRFVIWYHRFVIWYHKKSFSFDYVYSVPVAVCILLAPQSAAVVYSLTIITVASTFANSNAGRLHETA